MLDPSSRGANCHPREPFSIENANRAVAAVKSFRSWGIPPSTLPVIGNAPRAERKRRLLSPKQAISQATAVGAELTIAADGSMTFRPVAKKNETAAVDEAEAWINKHARN
jgi:serine/threonine protein kinase HipA of HipAB toxin-antitoxin module